MRALIVVFLAIFAGLCHAQSVQWTYPVPDTDRVKAARTPNGDFVLVNFEQTTTTHRVVARVISSSGTLVRRIVLFERPGVKELTIESMCVDATRIHVGTSSLDEGRPIGHVLSVGVDGTALWYLQLGNFVPRSAVTKNAILYLGGAFYNEVAANDRAQISTFNALNGTSYWSLKYFTSRSDMRDLAIGPGGNLYATGQVFGAEEPVFIMRVRDDGSAVYNATFDPSPGGTYNSMRLAFAPLAGKVFSAGVVSTVALEEDHFIVGASTSTGTNVAEQIVDLGPGQERLGGFVANNSGLYLFGWSFAGARLKRFTHTMVNTWTNSELITTGPISLGHHNDLILSGGGSASAEIRRVSQTDGTALWTIPVPWDGPGYPEGLIPDEAGNIFDWGAMSGSESPRSYIQKHRPATLFVSPTNLPGGGSAFGQITLSAQATSARVFSLTSSNTAALQIPSTTTVASGATQAAFMITTTPVAANTSVLITAATSGIIMQQIVTVLAPVVMSVTISPISVNGGVNTVGTVTLTGKAPTGGKVVGLASDKPAATVSTSVNVVAASSTATFGIVTNAVLVNTGVVITATTGSVSKTAFMAVNAPILLSLGVSPGSVHGGSAVSLTLTLNGISPSGYVVQLISGAPALVIIPSSTAMTAGLATKSLSVNTANVTTSVSITLIAYRGPYVRTSTVTLNP